MAMKQNAVSIYGTGFLTGCLLIAGTATAHVDQRQEAVLEAVIISEAAGEPYEGKVGVAEVLRNRQWNLRGFSGIQRKDLNQFLLAQPQGTRKQAQRALQKAREGSNITRNATHFENVERFGRPRWAKEMEATVKIGNHTFFRKRRV